MAAWKPMGPMARWAEMEPTTVRALAKKLNLHMVEANALKIRREKEGQGWAFFGPRGRRIRDRNVIRRLLRLAVPPAYENVLYAADPRAHLQAIGRDSAGRLQYRYHPDWEKIRDIRKAQRLEHLVDVLPDIRHAVKSALKGESPSRDFALAAIIALVDATAIRAGNDAYAREHKTRGATTLLKSNVTCKNDVVVLKFRAKGGKRVEKNFSDPALAKALTLLQGLPGRRLFQFADDNGEIRCLRSKDVNDHLRKIAQCAVSLKDFRTLCGSADALSVLVKLAPAATARERKKQIRQALEAAAQRLENTPTVCRKSYVHPAILTAFETGTLQRMARVLNGTASNGRKEKAVAEIIVTAA
jgi:DNA topoisomerase-1